MAVFSFSILLWVRPDEACQSIKLIQSDLDNYLKKNGMILEHYKYPDTYIRSTKKAYISIVNDSILRCAESASVCGYNALRLCIKRKGLDMRMGYCRKIFATYLRTHGIEQEVIDLLQGRIPKSVFAWHYFGPDFNESYGKVRQLLESLNTELA